MSVDTGSFAGRNLRLFRGSCGLTPRRRRQPGSGATRAEPVFPAKREGPARGRRRHAVAVEALAPPGAGCSRRDSYRDPRRNSVHKCPETALRGPILPFVYTIAIPRPPTTQAHGTTVYTNAPIRCGEARSSHLCTLLRSQGYPQPKPTAQRCTQMPRNGPEGPFPPICVHYCDPKATHNPSPRRNSVHKCPKMAPRGHFHRFVYTPASSPWR